MKIFTLGPKKWYFEIPKKISVIIMISIFFIVDGGWEEWGPWSFDCPTNCLQERKRSRSRTRTCSDPAPQGDGTDCVGENTDSHNCSKNSSICFYVAVLLQFHS